MSKKRKHNRIRAQAGQAVEQPRDAEKLDDKGYRPLTREELLKIANEPGVKGHFFENFWEFMSVFVQILLGFGVWVVAGSLLLFAIFKLFSHVIPEEEQQPQQAQTVPGLETRQTEITQEPPQYEEEPSQETYSASQDEGFVVEDEGGAVDEEVPSPEDDIVTEEY